jgi:hypothetical protein
MICRPPATFDDGGCEMQAEEGRSLRAALSGFARNLLRSFRPAGFNRYRGRRG